MDVIGCNKQSVDFISESAIMKYAGGLLCS